MAQKAENRIYATGKRKSSVARVYLSEGTGKISVNKKTLEEFFKRPVLRMIIDQPFQVTQTSNKFDIQAVVHGGGPSGQAGAIKHGISKALSLYDQALRLPLKKAGFITRDSRIKERKKYGLRGARRGCQFSKR